LKILILKPSSLGDVVQALPVLRLLKGHFRTADIFWWIDSPLAPLLEGDPDLAGLVRFERQRWAHPQNWPEMIRSLRWLRAQKFDLVIDLQCLLRSAVFGWLARQDFLIGLDETREGARGFYDVAVPRKSFHTHAVDWYLSVLPRLGVPVHPHYEWLPARPAVAEAIRSKWKTAGSRWITLQPGARWGNKRWPAENFARLISGLVADFPDTRFAVLGSNEDKALGEIIVQAAPSRCVNLCGATSLPEMVEWIRLGDLLITNDTGPMHVAAALGKPTLALFGPTESRRTGPYGQLQNVLRLDLPCSPCMKSTCHFEKLNECLRGLSTATVAERIKKMFPQPLRS
jgi:heptosyltransferase-1